MKKHAKIWPGLILIVAIVVLAGWYLHHHVVAVLQPAGEVGRKERNLIAFCAALSVLVIVPVFTMLGMFAWKYRESNVRAKYSPELEGNNLAETVWWLIPTALIAIIAVITWRSSYAMDPFKRLDTSKPTLHVQVVALDWKWLFIYPNQKVASVNEAAVPVGVPVDFEITSDAVMTSFWAPQLGGQMYAMPGMTTHLNLEATKLGSYGGVAANISGKGFAGMKFTVKAVDTTDFNNWLNVAKRSTTKLSATTYAQLARPSENVRPSYYGAIDSGLYDTIVMNYMMPSTAQINNNGGTI
ncbi:MAG TPA: COX aromatic rich motif-containing protein [Candidatus Saccharimonadia bacterium]|nr:COX aromatic rich motif-containing protein [Candidatus Saccharimonadia bacterium]